MFSRIIHHLDMKDVGKKHLEKLAAIKVKEEKDKKEKLVIKEISKRFESDWRKELEEGMTTTNVFSTTLPAEGDQAIDQVNPIDAASFADADNMFTSGEFGNTNTQAQNATTIRSSGSGSGNDGGFDVGGDYLAFQGSGSGGSRWAILKPMDATKVDTLTITAIRGTGTNGGERPDIAGTEELFIRYKTPSMNISNYLNKDPAGNNVGSFPADAAIIAINQGDGTLQNYTITIPEYARQKNVTFALYQKGNSGAGFDHYGVTDIKFQRRTPLNVVVPLDSPEAVSFVRVGTNEGDPKKRKKKVNDQLAASDEYVAKQMGDQFPGQGARIDGEDPFRSATVTSDEEIKSSPIGQDEVKKSFSDFSDDAADATAEPEPEPVEPAVQTTLAPRNLDGTKIRVKSVGKKAVQGVDAANLDAEPEAIEPETTEPEAIDPDDIKPEPEEIKDKTPKQQKQLEIDKKQEILNSELTKLENELNNITPDRDGFFNFLSVLAGGVQTVLKLAGAITNLTSMITGKPKPKWLQQKDIAVAKIADSIAIARSQLTGKIIGYEPNSTQINKFISSINKFALIETPGLRASIPVSSVRHEYADENIYVLNGKVYNNRDEKATDLTKGAFAGFVSQGQGYAQMIIPPDGGEPYVHYYDYGYNNLNNPNDIGGPFKKMISNLSDISLYLSSVPLGGRNIKGLIDPKKFLIGLQNTSSMEGWPPGIHGASLTDFKVPVSKLSKEVQEFIAFHPLSWTDERVANMSEDYLYQQFDILLEKEGVKYNYLDDGESYYDGILKILQSKGVNADPTYVDAVVGLNDAFEQQEEVYAEREKFKDNPKYNLAFEKAKEDYFKATDDYLESGDRLLSNEVEETVMAEIPDPEGEYPKFDWDSDPEVVKADRAYTEALNKSINYRRDVLFPAYDAYTNFANTLKQVGDMLEGTKAQIAQLRKLEKAGRAAKKESDRLEDEVDRLDKIAINANGNYMKKYEKLVEPWKEAEKKREVRRNELYDEIRKEVEEKEKIMNDLEVKYQNTYTVRDIVDGVEMFTNGGDYTDLNGKTYEGKGTLLNPFNQEIQELERQMDEYIRTSDQFGVTYGPKVISQYLVNKRHVGTVDWTPGKKGRGHIPGGYRSPRAKSNPRSYGTGYQVNDPFVTPTSTKKRKKKRGSGFNENYSLFEKIKTKTFFNPKDIKPTFPENPPAQIDPKTGMHPNYGKQAKRYNKLDPMSANAMPPTGDPEIDAVVDKQRTKKKPAERKKEYIKVSKVTETKTFSKIKNLRKKK